MQHRSNVLDVVKAVTKIAPAFPEVEVWWYVPRLLDNPTVELVIEMDGPVPDRNRIAQAVGRYLPDLRVVISTLGETSDRSRLYRVLTRKTTPTGSA